MRSSLRTSKRNLTIKIHFYLHRLNFVYCDFLYFDICYDPIAEPANKAFAITFPAKLHGIIARNYSHGFSSLHVLNDAIRVAFEGLAFPQFSPLLESFNELLLQMLSNGMIEKLVKLADRINGIVMKEDQMGPQVLSMDVLEIAFQICCVPLALSLVAFIGELVVFWSKRLWAKVKVVMIASAIVRAFFD